jgi:outer membrane PBP1 activator LpoA protein
MLKTTPIYLSSSIKTFTLTIIIMGLTACGVTPNKPSTHLKETPKQFKTEVKPDVNAVKKPKSYSLVELKALQTKALNESQWADYLAYSTEIWRKSKANPAYQAQIEDQIWSILNSLSAENILNLEESSNPDVQAWSTLFNTFNNPQSDFDMGMMNLKTFEADAIYQQHLLAKLITNQPQEQEIKQIAVLLPLEDRYQVVSEQIRSGIMKAFFASNQQITLKFYDTSVLENLEEVYTLAKQEGADRIIGPLRKEALQELASFYDTNLLALNTLENAPFTQFSLKSADASLQMLISFESAGYERLGILSNDSKRDLDKANTFQQEWTQANHNAELSIYPDERPKLRAALGDLIHEKQSKERKNNLRWLLGRNLSFFPRTRQDLDAVVIYDNANRMAVFRPQFDFFGLDTPVYGDIQLSPTNFQDIKTNADLNRVSFLTYPAVLNPADLSSKFEAFGWDSFIISTHMRELENGHCLASGKTGVLSLDNKEIKQQLVWAKYDKTGVLKEAPPRKIEPKITELTSNNPVISQ